MNDHKALILDEVRKYHQDVQTSGEFVPGVTEIWPTGAVHDVEDRVALVEAALDLRVAAGSRARKFESVFARKIKRRKALLTNSGSSANLLIVSALTSQKLGDMCLRPGDEVITVAAAFPTTVNPILQNGLVPVFVDVELGTYNPTVEAVERAIGPKTRAIMIAHTVGNPFPVAEMAQLAAEHDLFLIEDNCDALGSKYDGEPTGTFGDMASISFYPAHHMTMGEGGCVVTSNLAFARIVESLRDWGRDCWCEPGESNTCLKRFSYQMGTLPEGYDHKYIYSHVGYNLKITELQAALGLSQLDKIDEFCAARRRNWRRLREGLDGVPHLVLPEATPRSDPSWYGFVLTVDPQAPFGAKELVDFLEDRRIGTRRLFAGNIIRHPAYTDREYRIVGELTNTDVITTQTFHIGVYPGLTDEMIDYVVSSIREFVRARG
ncbi:lipopolysaccharide biosynthesis protein RfbH [Streptosporangium sandarakinum]|uniref:lipopolysaccharide biosynthesis protein RfbH n=1 Tax=Streptosporangium sandarakinum TaxID=1260955 RepID=UPI00341D0F45